MISHQFFSVSGRNLGFDFLFGSSHPSIMILLPLIFISVSERVCTVCREEIALDFFNEISFLFLEVILKELGILS